MSKLYPLSWIEFDEAVDRLVDAARSYQSNIGPVAMLWAIPRGGLVLGVALSHRLGLPLHTTNGPPTPLASVPGAVMIVDDIVDSGKTLAVARGQALTLGWGRDGLGRHAQLTVPALAWCTRLHSPVREGVGVYTARCVPGSAWIVFPWEDLGKAAEDCAAYHAKQAGLQGGL